MKTNIPERIAALREAMRQQKVDAYIIPSSDPHLSEYPADRWKSREWISGFTGSAGTIVVTADKAGLWTDSRYFLQAASQLEGSGIELYKLALPETPSITEFLLHELHAGQAVGLDGQTYSAAEASALANKLSRKEIKLDTSADLIEGIWKDRPAVPGNPIFEMPEALSGASVHEKLDLINNQLRSEGADCLILAALDEIAWTFNIRGTDVTYNPVVVSYAFVSEDESVLFIKPEKLTAEITEHLKKEGVTLAEYSMIQRYLSRLPENSRVFVDMNKTNVSLYDAIPGSCTIVEGISPANHLKSIKNETEIKGFQNAVVKDGVALTKFYIWLEKQMAEGAQVTEISAAEKLTALRAEQPQYIMDSFGTIRGYAEHGAIVHYSATPETDATLKPEGLLLIDSGAQYLDGTTDITRTIALGEPTEQMKKDFTRVLKGTISLAKSKFPAGTRGSQIDILARKALWDSGINYLHGTGHGIGHCLNVHKAWHDASESIRKIRFPMLADPTGALCRAFGVMIEEDGMAYRGTFLVNPEGRIKLAEIQDNNIGRNADELLRKVEAAQFVATHDGEVCPAKWKKGAVTLKPSIDLVGKI